MIERVRDLPITWQAKVLTISRNGVHDLPRPVPCAQVLLIGSDIFSDNRSPLGITSCPRLEITTGQ
jgi:hypothetical protein